MDEIDAIPLEDTFTLLGPNEAGMVTGMFYAFNTVITLQAFAEADHCRSAFEAARGRCRYFERRFSRLLPHSDVARLNAAEGADTEISLESYELLQASIRFCEASRGRFDITLGPAIRLWDFHAGTVPSQDAIEAALAHVDWRMLSLREEDGRYLARLADAQGAVDVGGTAKGYIADSLAVLMEEQGIPAFIVNLGGNVMAKGRKPDGSAWKIGLQDPKNKDGILGAIELTDASAVTSGIYERCFTKKGRLYHHILDVRTGCPVETDVAGVTVVSAESLFAEGYSTTLLALGIEEGIEFVRSRPEIKAAYFVDGHGKIYTG